MACAAIQSCKSFDGSITTAFEQLGRANITYSHHQFIKLESRYVLCSLFELWTSDKPFFSIAFVHWVTESNRPFQIINDPSLQMLIKMGRPDCYIPLAETLSHDVKKNICAHLWAHFKHVKGEISLHFSLQEMNLLTWYNRS
jgi:hypothetical protein